MVKIVFILLSLLFSPFCLIDALQCYESYLHTLNYTVTSATLPSLNESQIVSNHECWIEIRWYKNPSISLVSLYGEGKSKRDNSDRDELFLNIEMVLEPFVSIIKSEKALKYKCTSSNLCNNETAMKSLLDSLVFEERFPEEFNTLIQGAPFDNNTAETCFRYANTSFECEMPSLESCERCTIDVYQSPKGNQDICASCERLIEGNGILRNTTYLFDDRTQLDDIHIGCERPGCNSIENINKIRQFSTVTFDFDKFFGTPSSSATSLNISILFLIFFMTFQLCLIF